MIPPIPTGCSCSETSTCAEHVWLQEQNEAAERSQSARRSDALNLARILVAAEPLSSAEVDAQIALNEYSWVPHGLNRPERDLADWAYNEATRERSCRWQRAFASEVSGPVREEQAGELERWLAEVGRG